jgi:tape measure domain-containing protein
MASNDRVGALYYEVILDPRGFSRGASEVVREQNVMMRALQATVTTEQKLEAELIAIQKQMVEASGQELAILTEYQKKIREQLEDIERSKKEAAKADRRRRAEERLAGRYTNERLVNELRGVRNLNDLRNVSNKGMKAMSMRLGQVSGGLSKMAGNAAQAFGFGPQIQGMARALGALGLKAVFVGGAFVALAAAMVKGLFVYDAYVQKMQKLTALMGGNAQAANSLASEMEDFGNKTSFTTEQLTEFAIQMRNLGVRRADIKGLAETLGTLSFGDPEKLKLIGKAYSDVMAKGKLMAQEANQLANAQVPIWQALSKSLNKDVGTIREMTANGEITAQQMKVALEAQAEFIGGVGLLTARNDTMAGQWDIMKNTVNRIFRYIGELVHGPMVALMKLLNAALWVVEEVAYWIKVGILLKSGEISKTWEDIKNHMGQSSDLAFDMAEALADTYRIIAEQNIQAKEQVKTYEELLDAVQDRFRSEEELAERAYKQRMDQKVLEEEITQEQADRLIIAERAARLQEREQKAALENLEAIRKRQEQEAQEKKDRQEAYNKWYDEVQANAQKEFEGRVKEARDNRDSATEVIVKDYRNQMNQIDQELKDKIDMIDQASAGGESFEAGSKEEAAFLREMELQARRDAMTKQYETEADKERKEANKHLRTMVDDLSKLSQSQVKDLEKQYGLTAP